MTAPVQPTPAAIALSLRNTSSPRVYVSAFDPLSNSWEPWIGATDLVARISQYRTGYNFSGYPASLLGPFSMTQTADPGWYYCTITSDQLAALASYVGQTLFMVLEGSYGSTYYGITVVQPIVLVDPRFAVPVS